MILHTFFRLDKSVKYAYLNWWKKTVDGTAESARRMYERTGIVGKKSG